MESIEKRVVSLEEKYSYQDDLVFKLNRIVADQDRIISDLVNQVKSLSEMINSAGGGANSRNLEDDVPPHY